jgi:hypothetical protein
MSVYSVKYVLVDFDFDVVVAVFVLLLVFSVTLLFGLVHL